MGWNVTRDATIGWLIAGTCASGILLGLSSMAAFAQNSELSPLAPPEIPPEIKKHYSQTQWEPPLPLEDYFKYLDVQWSVDRLLKQDCVDAASRDKALAAAQQEIEHLLKYAKLGAESPGAKAQAEAHASVLNEAYTRLKDRKVCPPGGQTATGPSAPKETPAKAPKTSETDCLDAAAKLKAKILELDSFMQKLEAVKSDISEKKTELEDKESRLTKLKHYYEGAGAGYDVFDKKTGKLIEKVPPEEKPDEFKVANYPATKAALEREIQQLKVDLQLLDADRKALEGHVAALKKEKEKLEKVGEVPKGDECPKQAKEEPPQTPGEQEEPPSTTEGSGTNGWTPRSVTFWEKSIDVIWEKDGEQFTATYYPDSPSTWSYKGDHPEYPVEKPPAMPTTFGGKEIKFKTTSVSPKHGSSGKAVEQSKGKGKGKIATTKGRAVAKGKKGATAKGETGNSEGSGVGDVIGTGLAIGLGIARAHSGHGMSSHGKAMEKGGGMKAGRHGMGGMGSGEMPGGGGTGF